MRSAQLAPIDLDLLAAPFPAAAGDDDPLGLFSPSGDSNDADPLGLFTSPAGGTNDEDDDPLNLSTATIPQSINAAPYAVGVAAAELLPRPRRARAAPSRWAQAVAWAMRPTHEWAEAPVPDAPDDPPSPPQGWWARPLAPQAWLLRYRHYTEDSRVAWYSGAELLTAGFVTVMGSIAFEHVPYCVGRGVACCLVLSAQLGVLVALRPMVHRWRWLIICLATLLQAASAALSTANAVVQQQRVELAMDVLGVAVFGLMAIVTIVESAAVLQSLAATLREAATTIRKHIAAVRAAHSCKSKTDGSAALLEERLLRMNVDEEGADTAEGHAGADNEGDEMVTRENAAAHGSYITPNAGATPDSPRQGATTGAPSNSLDAAEIIEARHTLPSAAPSSTNAASLNGTSAPDESDAVRSILRDFGQYLRERGEVSDL